MDPATLSFDVCQRFNAFARLIRPLAREAAPRILDVGGSPGTLGDFLQESIPGCRVITLDRKPCPRKGYVAGSADQLPFRNQAFDLVISSDMLEHIPAQARGATLREIRRVASRWIILGAPFFSHAVEFSETAMNALHKKCLGHDNPWLGEHISNGLPALDETIRLLALNASEHRVFPAGSIEAWFVMEGLQFVMDALPLFSTFKKPLNSLFNRFLLERDSRREPAYRHMIAVSIREEFPGGFPAEANPILPERPEKDVMDELQALHNLFTQMAGAARQGAEDSERGEAVMAGRYIRQVEQILDWQEKDQLKLRADLDKKEERIQALVKNPLYRILRKLGFLPPL